MGYFTHTVQIPEIQPVEDWYIVKNQDLKMPVSINLLAIFFGNPGIESLFFAGLTPKLPQVMVCMFIDQNPNLFSGHFPKKIMDKCRIIKLLVFF